MWIEILKVFFWGILQGITEWLPISSTGHMILLERWLPLSVSPAFLSLFRVVIQLGSILAVVLLYGRRLFPWSRDKTPREQTETIFFLCRILLATLPACVCGILLDDFLDRYLFRYDIVAAALILYGIAFLLVEKRNQQHPSFVDASDSAEAISTKQALAIGCFQVLSLIPGTSRSGSTILGAMLLGISRPAAATFSFFLAIPVMFGASLLKIAKAGATGLVITSTEWVVLSTGCLTAFAVSLIVIRFLVGFVRRHSFAMFGWYRILLGILVILYAFLSQ